MIKKKKYLYFLIGLFSLIIMVVISPLRGDYFRIGFLNGSNICSLAGFSLYFCYTFYILYKYSGQLPKTHILLAIFIGGSFFQLPMRIISFYGTYLTFLDYLIHQLGILIGFLTYVSNKKYRFIIGTVGFICGIWLSVDGNNMWDNKWNFKTYTGKVENSEQYKLTFQNPQGDTLSLANYKGGYVLLDCWYTYCGSCYREFPGVETLSKKYKDNPSVKIYALHFRMENEGENTYTGAKILSESGFEIPSLSIDIEDPVMQKIEIPCFPTFLIFDREGKLIFKGNTELAQRLISKLVKE
ncbi:TlpA disulfide reductase family protein [Prevotella sp. 10(H)]|uniref:TlpA family protein disulfide reductase n=1 Tax=Prevotella sp. 10(H) TaxID=1158294 RepID=UPI0004A744BE|nr:TlpA disulfide reductase family protein [Prevotella sp. 10(H)]